MPILAAVRAFGSALTAIALLVAATAPAIAQTSTDWITGLPREAMHVKAWPGGKKVAVCFVLYVEVWGHDHGPNFRPDMNGRTVGVSLRVTSGGTALMHEMGPEGRTADPTNGDDDPITMLYIEGDRLLLTHYCDTWKNRPRMSGKLSPGGKTVEFEFLDVAGTVQTTERLRAEEARATRAESLRTRAELEALRAQLNPHFLFNTLHSLMALVRHDPIAAEDALERLTSLLRHALMTMKDAEDVVLSEELDFVESYFGAGTSATG